MPTSNTQLQQQSTPAVERAHATAHARAATNEPDDMPAFEWPAWARTARIAGAYFAPGNDDIDARLDRLAAQNVSVIITDSPLGQQYEAWVDDATFAAVRDVIATVVDKAHQRGLKVVLYHTGLELLSDPQRKPRDVHLAWAQRSLRGKPLLYNDVTNEQEHWLDEGVWDLWVSPCDDSHTASQSFRQLSLARIRAMVATGIDGLWVDQVYLQSSVGGHHELWPSSDPCSRAAFTAATGLKLPDRVDWDDPVFQRWVVWRHSQIVDFLLAELHAARSINPEIVFLNENSSVDTGRSTYVATDATALLPYASLTTGHEIETIADRMDEGETGMVEATLDEWLAMRTMVAFARAADRGKPSWVLTYGFAPRDSAQLAGMVLAEGANFYETKGPQMADSVGAVFRTQLFGWIAAHEAELYASESAAQVAVLYSPRTRDLLDTVSGEPYDVADSVHFAAYRATANLLYRAHIPFDIVIDQDVAAFDGYAVLIVPEVRLMDGATAAVLRRFEGRLITIGEVGVYDEWFNAWPVPALDGIASVQLAAVQPQIIDLADTGLLTTTYPPAVQLGLRTGPAGVTLIVVNTGAEATAAGEVTVRVAAPLDGTEAHLTTLEGREVTIPLTAAPDHTTVRLTIPAGIDTVALVTIPVAATIPASNQLWLPLNSHQP